MNFLKTTNIRIQPNISVVLFLSIFVFFLHYPGQASIDTILQLKDGLTGKYDSNQPPAMSFILANLTLLGTLILSILLFSLSVIRLLYLTQKNYQWIIVIFLFFFPVLFTYIGIVWKDVLFAHAALLGLLLLPRDEQLNWKALILSAVVLALGTSVRQQGAIILLIAILYLLSVSSKSGLRFHRWKVISCWVIVYILFFSGIKSAVDISGDTSKSVAFISPFYQLLWFDIGGIAYDNPGLNFPAIEESNSNILQGTQPAREKILKVVKFYNPERQDYMWKSIEESNLQIPFEAFLDDWTSLILRYPRAYILHRLNVFSWIIGYHDTEKCVPYYFGISSQPEEMVAQIGIKAGISGRAKIMEYIGKSTLFLYRPIIYLILSFIVVSVLIRHNWYQHRLIIAIQVAGFLYTITYLFIGIACDFRYTYFSTLAALFGVAYIFGRGLFKTSSFLE